MWSGEGPIAHWSLIREILAQMGCHIYTLKLISRAIERAMSRPDPINTLVRIPDFKYRTPEKLGVPGARSLITFF